MFINAHYIFIDAGNIFFFLISNEVKNVFIIFKKIFFNSFLEFYFQTHSITECDVFLKIGPFRNFCI